MNREKKKYERPVVRRFALKAEEAVLGFCKTASISGSNNQPGNTGCNNNGVPCRAFGS
jgi:hypothetical protein